MAKIVVAGSLNMDLVAITPRIPVAGETIIGGRFFTAPGGKGANQAYAAAKLGGDVAVLGCVGEDDFGRAMRANLASVGCDVAGVQSMPGSSGVALIAVAGDGANSIVVAPGANDAFRQVDPAAFANCQIALFQLETPLETVTGAARLAKQSGARVVLDPAPAPACPLPSELLRNVDIVTPNETEAAILAGLPPRELTTQEAAGIAAKLRAQGIPVVIVKLGAKGCWLSEGESQLLIPAPKVNAIDSTAAGDTFNAALAVAMSEGQTLAEACRFAVKAGAVSVTRLGAQASAPTRTEVDRLEN